MTRLFLHSLRRKLILLVTGVTSITVLITCAGLGAYQWHHARNTLYEQESAAAQMTADSSAAALLFADRSAAVETLDALRSDPRILAACLFEKTGAPAGSFLASARSTPCPDQPPVAGALTLTRLTIVRPVRIKGSHVGTLFFDVSLAELNRLTIGLAEAALFATLAASLFAFLLSSITEQWISKPIVDLTRIAVQVAQNGSRVVRATRTSHDEIGILVQQFNAMLDRLHEREEELRSAGNLLETKVQERTQNLQDEIAERKLVEMDLHHAKDLAEEANRAKSSFLANMSHELRTPLNAIIGYSEMLHEDAQDAAQAGMRDDLSKILSSARHLLGVISDVLDLSKIEAGQMKVHLELFAARLLIQDVLPIAAVLVKNNANQLRIEDDAADALLLVDALRFRQCLLNLLSNACKFTSDGIITLQTALRERAGVSWVVWSIIDTGIGIPAESLSRLFQSFSQVDGSATRRHGGTGLGLCISQELCRAMNGFIEVESTIGEGSAFRIWMPLASETAPERDDNNAGSALPPLGPAPTNALTTVA